MPTLILGLLIFFAAHSVRIVADDWRSRQIARIGELAWKGLYSLVSAVGLGLLVWGFSLERPDSPVLWSPPIWTRHLAALLTLPAFVLLAAAYVPDNRIKAAVGHPMAAGVSLWALGHLLANGSVVHVLLFGTFLVWSVLVYRAAHNRDRAAGIRYPVGSLALDALVIVVGIVAWGGFAFYLHQRWIGVSPFG